MRTVHRFQHFDMSTIFNDTTKGEFFLLEILLKQKQQGKEGCFVYALAELLAVSSPAVSRMMRRLDARGWIRRQIDPSDRRNILVYITPMGEESLKETQQLLKQFGDNITQRMGDSDMQQLIHLWNRLLDTMDEELDTLSKEKESHA